MGVGHSVNAILLHEWVRLAGSAVNVELFFEERVDRGVQIERWHGGLANTQAAIQVKTPGAAGKVFNFGA